jgi:hypothetical protein
MIRIALIIGQLGLGGAEKQLFQLATQLPRWHYHPCVIVLSAGEEWVKELRTRVEMMITNTVAVCEEVRKRKR